MSFEFSQRLTLDSLKQREAAGLPRSTAEGVRLTAEKILQERERFEIYVDEGLFTVSGFNSVRKMLGLPLKPPAASFVIYSALTSLSTGKSKQVQHIPTLEPGRNVPAYSLIHEEAELTPETIIPEESLNE